MNQDELRLTQQLKTLYLSFIAEHYPGLADEAARQQWTAVQYLARLIEGETHRRQERQILRRLTAARFPVLKTLEQFNWTWPKKVNQAQVQNLFRLAFLKDKASVVFIGGVGLGKTHLATALGHAACLQGHTVLFTHRHRGHQHPERRAGPMPAQKRTQEVPDANFVGPR